MDSTYTIDELRAKVRDAFKRCETVHVETMEEDRAKIVAILDAIEDDMRERLEDCRASDNLAYSYDTRADLLEFFADREAAFDAALTAYTFNPYNADSRSEPWTDSAHYFAFDGYAHLVAIRNRADLARWYECCISDYLGGNYGEPDENALEALAEVFNG